MDILTREKNEKVWPTRKVGRWEDSVLSNRKNYFKKKSEAGVSGCKTPDMRKEKWSIPKCD